MWKILQAVPRGIRNGLACYARRNPCLEEDQQRPREGEPSGAPPRGPGAAPHRNYSQQRGQHFRVRDDCWSFVHKHSLLEALGWGAAVTAGLVAGRPELGQERSRDQPSSLLLEYAAAMPVTGVRDSKPATRSRVLRADSGYSEAQSQESTTSPRDLSPKSRDLSPRDSSRDQPCDAKRDYDSSASSTGSQFESDFSWDSSSGSSLSSNSYSSRLLDSLNVFTVNDVIKQQNDVTKQKNDFTKHHDTVKQNHLKQDIPTSGAKAKTVTRAPDDVTNKRDDVTAPGTFREAVLEFEEVCRQAWGRHCHHEAVKALRAEDGLGAAHHWVRASRAGYDKGQYNLGRCYEDGIGTYKDVSKAKYYYGLASAQGHAAARERLQRLSTTETGARMFSRWSSGQTAASCRLLQEDTVR